MTRVPSPVCLFFWEKEKVYNLKSSGRNFVKPLSTDIIVINSHRGFFSLLFLPNERGLQSENFGLVFLESLEKK